MYILTAKHNDGQYGEYFVAAWYETPDITVLRKSLDDYLGEPVSSVTLVHVLTGGGREGVENIWFHLYEYVPSTLIAGAIRYKKPISV